MWKINIYTLSSVHRPTFLNYWKQGTNNWYESNLKWLIMIIELLLFSEHLSNFFSSKQTCTMKVDRWTKWIIINTLMHFHSLLLIRRLSPVLQLVKIMESVLWLELLWPLQLQQPLLFVTGPVTEHPYCNIKMKRENKNVSQRDATRYSHL